MTKPWWLIGGLVLCVAVLAGAFLRERDRRKDLEKRLAATPVAPKPVETDRDLDELKRKIERLEGEVSKLRTEPRYPPVSDDVPARPVRHEDAAEDWKNRAADELRRGSTLFREGRHAEAAASWTRAVSLDPMNTNAYLLLALEAFARGRWSEAVNYLSRAMGTSKEWLKRAKAPWSYFRSKEEYFKYLQELERREAAEKRDVDAKIALAYHYYFVKGAEHARALLQEAQALDPGNATVREFLDQLK